MSAPDLTPGVHGDERTPPTRYAGIAETAQSESAPLSERLVAAAASAICRKGDPHATDGLVPAMVWHEAREATVAVLRGIEAVLNDWTDEDYSASDALDLVADAADEIAGSVSGGGNADR